MNEKILAKLRPWQREPAQHLRRILESADSALDASDTGTGKSFMAAAVAVDLGLPTLVICPKISVSMWHRVASHFEDSFSILNYELLRGGKTLYGSWQHQEKINAKGPITLVCQYCQRRFSETEITNDCYTNESKIHCVEVKRTRVNYGYFIFNNAVQMVIYDECHRCGGLDSLNAELLIAAKRQKIKHLLLSATPAQTILQMKAIGYSLDLFEL